MNEREALKLALDALYCSDDFLFDSHDCEPNNERELRRYEHARAQNIKAIEAIRKVLAQSDQESDDLTIAYMSGFHDGKNKYAPQREWVGLTDEEKHDCYLRIDIWSRCVEMVEAKLKEKNFG